MPAPPPEEKSSGLGKTAVLAILFALWYLANIYFNIYNKQVLKAFPFPLTITAFQFGMGSTIATIMWILGLHKPPETDAGTLKTISPLAVIHTLGNALTNVSLGSVAVSFTHTIKAMEPFFSVALSALFLGDKPSFFVMLSLVPIVGGVGLASLSEATFNWKGFSAAVASSVTFQSRNVLSKKFMNKGKGNLDNINLFSILTMMSFLLLTPIAIAVEGFHFTPAGLQALGITDPRALLMKALVAGLCFHAYQQVSYMILQRVSPVTHSIGNCVKRVVVIVASLVVFQNPVTRQNALGTAVALAGVFMYSQAKRFGGKKAKAA